MGDTHRITLPDGRTLCYADLGDADGAPVLMMHGTPGYRLNWKALPEYPFLPGVRLIAPDRPGYGLSSPRPGATYADWPADVAALADALHLDRFAVLGGSGGGPPALACGWAMPERVERIALVSSVGPPVHAVLRAVNRTNRTAYALARHVPWLMRRNMRFLAWLQRRDLDGFIDWTSRKLSASDRAAVARPTVRAALRATMSAAAVRRDASGYGQDVINQSRPWPFPLDGVAVPVHLWQPVDDTSAPPEVACHLGPRLPDCWVRSVPDAGHLWHVDHAAIVLRTLLQR